VLNKIIDHLTSNIEGYQEEIAMYLKDQEEGNPAFRDHDIHIACHRARIGECAAILRKIKSIYEEKQNESKSCTVY